VRHIGNGHHQPVTATRARLAKDGVIKIAGGFIINRDQPHIADIDPVCLIFLGNLFGNARRLLAHGGWPAVWNLVGADCYVDFHPRSHMLPENFNNTPCRLGAHGGLAQNFHHHVLAMHSFAGMLIRHQNLVIDARILRHHKSYATLFEEATNCLAGAMLQHLNNHPLTTATIIHAVYTGSDPVAMKHLAHLTRREEQV